MSKNTTPKIPVSRYLAEVYLSCNPRDAVQWVNTLCLEIPETRFRFQEDHVKNKPIGSIQPTMQQTLINYPIECFTFHLHMIPLYLSFKQRNVRGFPTFLLIVVFDIETMASFIPSCESEFEGFFEENLFSVNDRIELLS